MERKAGLSSGKVCAAKKFRGYSAAGSAPAWHAGGQGFKSP
ncbi:MAG: hypothetical protein RLZZ159_396 [Actinomycetota bacterium]|jgi:hypothetical protein